MIWLLLVYVMGVLLAQTCLDNTIEYFVHPAACLMWPILVLALVFEWVMEIL
jgi:hypothetical protein